MIAIPSDAKGRIYPVTRYERLRTTMIDRYLLNKYDMEVVIAKAITNEG
jgi:hypothetical protein